MVVHQFQNQECERSIRDFIFENSAVQENGSLLLFFSLLSCWIRFSHYSFTILLKLAIVGPSGAFKNFQLEYLQNSADWLEKHKCMQGLVALINVA